MRSTPNLSTDVGKLLGSMYHLGELVVIPHKASRSRKRDKTHTCPQENIKRSYLGNGFFPISLCQMPQCMVSLAGIVLLQPES